MEKLNTDNGIMKQISDEKKKKSIEPKGEKRDHKFTETHEKSNSDGDVHGKSKSFQGKRTSRRRHSDEQEREDFKTYNQTKKEPPMSSKDKHKSFSDVKKRRHSPDNRNDRRNNDGHKKPRKGQQRSNNDK